MVSGAPATATGRAVMLSSRNSTFRMVSSPEPRCLPSESVLPPAEPVALGGVDLLHVAVDDLVGGPSARSRPWSIQATRSQSVWISARLCETNTIVVPLRRSS